MCGCVKLYKTFTTGLVYELEQEGTTLSEMHQDLRSWLQDRYAAL